MAFPLFKTKIDNLTTTFDLATPAGRYEYFQTKVGSEIEELKEYLDRGSFLSFWLAKKGAGKGTYSKMLGEIFGEHRLAHVSVGDIVRHVHSAIESPEEKQRLLSYLETNYRGTLAPEDALDALVQRDTKTLLPTEFILALVKREIEQVQDRAIMIDGFPRGLDQISYSLYFREIMNLRDDPDLFVLIDIPDSVLDARVKSRVVCPRCNLSRNTRFLTTKTVEYDEQDGAFYLLCENPSCEGYETQRMLPKEGDELGLEGIRERLEADEQLIQYALKLRGVPLIKLRNTIPVSEADKLVDEYEITPEYMYSYDGTTKQVTTTTKPWVVQDKDGIDSYSLLAPPVTVSLIKQLHQILILDE